MLPFSLDLAVPDKDGNILITETKYDSKIHSNVVIKEFLRDKDYKIITFHRLESSPDTIYNAIYSDLESKLTSVNDLISYNKGSVSITSYSDYTSLHIKVDDEDNKFSIEIRLGNETKEYRKLHYIFDNNKKLESAKIYIKTEELLRYKELMDLLM